MDARAIIAKVRHEQTPTDAELIWFSNGLATGAVSDAQAGAFAMARQIGGVGRDLVGDHALLDVLVFRQA